MPSRGARHHSASALAAPAVHCEVQLRWPTAAKTEPGPSLQAAHAQQPRTLAWTHLQDVCAVCLAVGVPGGGQLEHACVWVVARPGHKRNVLQRHICSRTQGGGGGAACGRRTRGAACRLVEQRCQAVVLRCASVLARSASSSNLTAAAGWSSSSRQRWQQAAAAAARTRQPLVSLQVSQVDPGLDLLAGGVRLVGADRQHVADLPPDDGARVCGSGGRGRGGQRVGAGWARQGALRGPARQQGGGRAAA